MEIKEIVITQRELEGVFTQWAREMATKEGEFVSHLDLWERCKEDPEKVGKSHTICFLKRLVAFIEKEILDE